MSRSDLAKDYRTASSSVRDKGSPEMIYEFRLGSGLNQVDVRRALTGSSSGKLNLYPARYSSRFRNRFPLAAIVIVILCMTAAAQKKSSCIECHIKLDDPRLSAPAKLFENDIHKSRGLS